ncbi:hypothetical protein M8J76_003360 [Diaphorina citri]|nr:hypothetical protein M8J75_010028 [Diaphorina citri]KAI5740394.1 hypothetical protein M8J76_003360 [Diaphorina citri]
MIMNQPMVTLRLGPKLKPNAIKEGDDVYFECKVRANPKEHKITWYHNGIAVKRNSSSGVILSTESLVLQKVSRHNSGRYTCQAVNDRGETSSHPVTLRVQYSPVCKFSEPTIVGASINEAVKVKCLVTSDPRDLSFVWKFNNNGEDFDVNPSKYNGANTSSSDLVYTPLSERDYGTLACWGRNVIGQQLEPCTFQVVPAARPGALKNCTLRSTVNDSGDWLEIQCLAGYDGGLPQVFHLEAIEATSHKLYANLSSTAAPIFRLELGSMSSTILSPILQLILYASNLKGKSEMLLLEDIALRDPEKRTEWVTGGVGGAVSSSPLIMTACILIIVISIVLLICFLLLIKKHNAPSSSLSLGDDDDDVIKQQLTTHQHGGGGLDERFIVSYQLKPNDKQPDILSRVSDDPLDRDSTISQCEYNNNTGVIASFMSPCETPVEGLAPSRPQTLAYSPSSSSTTGNGTLRKNHHLLANNIPGPESCV